MLPHPPPMREEGPRGAALKAGTPRRLAPIVLLRAILELFADELGMLYVMILGPKQRRHVGFLMSLGREFNHILGTLIRGCARRLKSYGQIGSVSPMLMGGLDFMDSRP